MTEEVKLDWLYTRRSGLIGLFDTIFAVAHPQFVGGYISENLINYYQGLVRGHTQFAKLTGLLKPEEIDILDEIIDGWFTNAREEAHKQAIERAKWAQEQVEKENE